MLSPVGIVGLGNAGSALATALSGQFPLVGFDANPARREAVAGLKLEYADSVATLGAQVQAVILSLPKPEASIAVVTELVASDPRPQLIIETSTITPAVALQLAAICEAADVAFVDAAIAGGVAGMAAGTNTFLVGAHDADYELAHPILDAMASRILRLGPPSTGMAAKVVNNAVMHSVMVVLIEASAMAVRSGIPLQTLIDILNGPDGLVRPLNHRVQERMMGGNYEGGMSVSNARKDSLLALEVAQDLGIPLFAIQATHAPYEIAQSTGMGDLDYAALATLWEQWAGVEFNGDDETR